MVKDNLGYRALLQEIKLRNRIDPRIPATRSPSLNNSLIWYKFDVPSRHIAAEKRKRSTCFWADLRGLASRCHAGLHSCTEQHHLVELFRVCECFINALPARLENGLLVNGFRRMRNLLHGLRPALR